jgi:hypothetical protein
MEQGKTVKVFIMFVKLRHGKCSGTIGYFNLRQTDVLKGGGEGKKCSGIGDCEAWKC